MRKIQKMKLKHYIPLLMLLLLAAEGTAQKVAVKTNLLYDAAATVNLGAEVVLAPRWTLDVSGNLNAWNMSHDRKWKHWMIQPEARYWLCQRFIGHFFGFHLHGGQYNIGNLDNSIKFLGTDFSKLSDARYEGWFLGAGLGYGHSWVIDRHWNLEAEIGVGYSYSPYEKYPCADCGKRQEKDKHHYIGVTKAALNLIYNF